jgi:aminoglycoside phosphotransferase (APT) family kinase protein
MLTQGEVVPYLLRRRLIRPESVLEGDLVVVDASRRNRDFKVVSERGPSYLLKQGVGSATVAHEARMYLYFHSAPAGEALRPYLPRCFGYDDEARILVLELVRDAESLREHHVRRRRFSVRLGATLGAALAALHRPGVATAEVGGSPPWILSLHRPHSALFREVSSANLRLIRVLQRFPVFGERLDELREGWRREAVVHNDVKWDNVLVVRSEKAFQVKLIDWELADVGDPCWDVGGAFNDYLSQWLLSIPITGDAPPERFLELAPYPLERMQPAIRAFWSAYVHGMGLEPASAERWLERAVRYAAARLVQTAYEQMQGSWQLTGNVVCILQLSLNILQRPRHAAAHLLGIPLPGVKSA